MMREDHFAAGRRKRQERRGPARILCCRSQTRRETEDCGGEKAKGALRSYRGLSNAPHRHLLKLLGIGTLPVDATLKS